MVHLFLDMKSREKSFQFDFPQDFKPTSIAVVSVNGTLECDKNSFTYVTCSFICDSYLNERQSNILCKFASNDKKVKYEPYNLVSHKIVNKSNTLVLKLLNDDYKACDIHIELLID